ncbi:MAG: hypothetical protein IT244_11775 [Bacteroidia bacterium]|nr:hypothetical protein [Bacteroidia bacterium]
MNLKNTLTTALMAFTMHVVSGQDTSHGHWQMHIGWRAFNTNLNTFNSSMPNENSHIQGPLNAVEMGMSYEAKRFLLHSGLAIGTRNRGYVSDYEQFILTQTRWTFTGGPVFKLGKNKGIQFSTLAGVGYSSLDLRYQNDTLNKASSISWIINQQPTQLDEDPRHYTNPGFIFLVEQNVSVVIRKNFMFTGFVGYQSDMGKGNWHYEYGFIRRNSPKTFTTGLTYGATLGLRIPIYGYTGTN